MNNKFIRSIFWAMAAVFIIIICAIFIRIPNAGGMFNIILPGIAVLFLLGTALIVLTVKTKVPGKPGKFLLLAGASAAGLPVFVVLHNLVSGLLNIEEAVFFIIATIVCPLVFLAGVIGTIILTVKTKSSGGIA